MSSVPSLLTAARYESVAVAERDMAERGYVLYEHIRSGASGLSSTTPARTLELMSVALQTRKFGRGMPPSDATTLARLSAAYDWEGAYQRKQALEELGPEDKALRDSWAWLSEQLPDHRKAIERFTAAVMANGAATQDDAKTSEKLWATYFSAAKELHALDQRLRERIAAHNSAMARSKRVDDLYARLLSHYGARGPQYEIACRSLAIVTTDIEASRQVAATHEPSFAREGVDGLKTLVQLQVGLINQLQKFTESAKVDVTNNEELKKVAQAVASCALRRVMGIQPQLAMQILDDMDRELAARGYAGTLARSEDVQPVLAAPEAEEIASS